MVFDDFSADRGPKMGVPGVTTDLATPPPGGQKRPRKSARGLPGPKRRPRDLVKGPRDPARSPPGGPGGARGDPGGPRGGHGGLPQLLLHVPTNIDGFLEMLLWPLFRAGYFFSKPDLNWAARGR